MSHQIHIVLARTLAAECEAAALRAADNRRAHLERVASPVPRATGVARLARLGRNFS